MSSAPKSNIPTPFHDHARTRRRGVYWVTPAMVLILYICVMAVFFWLQRIHDDSVMFVTIDQEMRQQRLIWVVLALSCVIVISLLMLWRYTRFRSSAEAALIAETGFRRAMENSMSTGMRVLDMEGRIAYVNPAFCRMIGWNEADLIGRSPPFPYWVPGRHEQHQHTLDVLMSGKTPSSGLEVEAQRRDGSRFTARMYVSPLLDPNGNQIGWMTSMTDITEPKRIREALTAAHERFMTVLEGLDDAISVTADTHDGLELLFANRTYRRVFGAQTGGHDELLAGRRGRFTDESVEVFAPSVQRWFEVHHRMLAWTDGRRVRMQVARDITERRVHEEASRVQQEKIQLTSRLTTMKKPASQAERAGKIISRIREFVKRSEPRRQRVAIGRIVDNAIGFAEIDARKRRIRIDSFVPSNAPDVLADPILIEQVLLNLLKNGLEAMEKSESDELKVAVILHDQHIEVAVVDRGHGLAEPERLFEPFFSTKTQGLGMGLNICRTIIESHHGRLWADPNPAGGTIFRFTLPCAATQTQAQNDQSEELHA